MRNPALRLVGIGVSPQGGGVFGTRAEEELRLWLESRLDALGIDPVAYSRFVLSLLRRPDSALSPPHGEGVDTGRTAGGGGRRHRVKPRSRIQGDRDQRHAVVQCLTNAADQKCGVESLVDELCAKLRDLEGGGGGSNEDKEECRKIDGGEKNTVVETLTPRDRALRYYAAFPALQPATPKKTIHKKDKNNAGAINNHKNRIIGINGNNIKNSNKNNINNHSHIGSNNRGRHKKSRMPIPTIDAQRSENKETFGFAKSMEREREKERELELDQLRLAQLQAKFDESLEALWDTGPSNAQDKASIWAAPSLSIPSGPLWPVDTGEVPLILPINDTVSTANTPYQDDSIVDDSPIISWDIDSIGKYTDDTSGKDKIDYNLNWSDYVGDGPWNWKDLGNNLMNMSKSPKTTGCFIPVTPRKSPIINNSNNNSNNNNDKSNNININNNNNKNDNTKESSPQQKVNSLEEVDEDLLTSARTHFRPIKDDGHWADGTTFPVNNNIERVTYRRSESGNLLYLPGDESPYMEYRESTTPLPISSANLTLKFRVRQCDKSIQTDPIRSPVKRRIIAEADHFYYSSVDADDILTNDSDDIGKDSFTLGQLGWMQPSVSLLNDRKRRHSSSFHCRPLAALRPLTL